MGSAGSAFHDGLDFRQLLLDLFGESELHCSTLEVVIRPVGAEVEVPLKVVGEKTQTELKGNQANAVRHIVRDKSDWKN